MCFIIIINIKILENNLNNQKSFIQIIDKKVLIFNILFEFEILLLLFLFIIFLYNFFKLIIIKMKESNTLNNNYEVTNQLKFKNKSNINNKKEENICSLKPQKFNIQKDIYIYDIYQNMIKEVNIIFPAMPKKVDLNYNQKNLRKELISQMRIFLRKYRLNELCLFHSIYLMDKLLAKKIKLNINEVAIACLFISVKFINIDNDIPPINNFLEILKNNQKISIKELLLLEIECLKKLNYKISIPQPINFISLILMNGIVFNTDIGKNKMKIGGLIYNLPIEIYYEIISINTDYLQFHPLYIAFTCIAMARELFHLDKWSPFVKVFNITFSEFEEVYQFLFDLYIECREKKKLKEESLKRKINFENIEKDRINSEEKNNNIINILKEKNNLNKNNIKSEKKVDSMKNQIDIKSLRHYYINKTKFSNINFDQLDFLFKGKGENNKELKESLIQNTQVNIKKNFINPKNSSSYQKLNNKSLIEEIKVNQSFNNYFQQLKNELPNSSRNNKKNLENENNKKKVNEDNIKGKMFYNTIKKKSNLVNYTILNSLNSTISKAKKTFLKETKNTSISFLNNSLNKSSLNNNSFSNNKTYNRNNSNINTSKKMSQVEKNYLIKVLARTNNKIESSTESNF